ncbi:MAG: hypothetical protein QGF46_04370, partial [Planctomycetota bacterium]|nr:hypothetical protein [Planctomycetota bacterium]
ATARRAPCHGVGHVGRRLAAHSHTPVAIDRLDVGADCSGCRGVHHQPDYGCAIRRDQREAQARRA